MKTMFKSLVVAAVMVVGTIGISHACESHEYELGSLHIEHPFARATVGPARVSAAYLTIKNAGDADTLIAASTDVAGKVELHTMDMANGVMRMREVEGGIALPANETVSLKPGGLHIMLLGLDAPLVEGETFPLTLTFEQAGEIVVDVAVESPAAKGHSGHNHHGHDHHGHDHKDHSHDGHNH